MKRTPSASLAWAIVAALGTACSGDDPESPREEASALTGVPDAMGAGGTSASTDAADTGDTSASSAGAGASDIPGAGVLTMPPAEAPPSLEELAAAPAEEVPWTILVYGHADHNLSFSLLRDMTEMAAAEFDGAVQLLVLADWDSSQVIPGSDPPTNFPDGLHLYRIAGGEELFTPVAQGAESNLDDPLELADIIAFVFSALPAQRRGLVLWDHGGAWRGGFGGDTQNGTVQAGLSTIDAQRLATAVRLGLGAAGITQSPPLDFIGFDTCLMAGAEVAFPFRDLTDIYIAAAELDYGEGWDYEATVTHFARNPSAPTSELAIAEVSHWDAHHASATLNDALLRSHAALDLSKLDAFAAATATLSGLMVDSDTFDPLELGRSAFFSLSPYSSELEQGINQPGLRDFGQLLDLLGAVQSDSAVADAARAARSALDEVVLASAQGDLRAGTQVGMHVEQSLGSNLTPERLQDYRTLASQWVEASRWDEVLELASAASDADPPLFTRAVTNAEASRAAPPVVELRTEDETAAKAEVYAALQTPSDSILVLGLVGAGLVEANATYEFAWDGAVVGFADGQPGMAGVWLDVAAGEQPIVAIPGLVDGITSEPVLAYLLFGAAEQNASQVTLTFGSKVNTASTFEIVRAFPEATFTPAYVELGAGPEPGLVLGDPLAIPGGGFPLVRTYLGAGSYFLATSVSDIWGNEGEEMDAIELIEPLGP